MVRLGDIGLMSFVVARDVIDEDSRPVIRYLLASTPRLSAREVVWRYRQRWTIEVFFRDLKQHLSIKDHRGRSLVAAHHHVACACMAAVALDHLRMGSGMSPCEAKQLLRRLVFIDTGWEKYRLALLRPSAANMPPGLDDAKRAVRRQLFRVTGLSLKPPVALPDAA